MAQEIHEGTAYLLALKQSSAHQGKVNPTHETQDNPPSTATVPATNAGDRFLGAEKRRSPRFKCEGSAQVSEDGCDVSTWVTFTDVSLHGCYVEA